MKVPYPIGIELSVLIRNPAVLPKWAISTDSGGLSHMLLASWIQFELSFSVLPGRREVPTSVRLLLLCSMEETRPKSRFLCVHSDEGDRGSGLMVMSCPGW